MINEYRLREFLFWMVGGLDFRRWDHVLLAVGPIMTGSVILMMLGRHLNVLVLGDTEARALGLPVMVYSHAIPVLILCSYCYCRMCQRFHWLCRPCSTAYCASLGGT